MIPSSFGPSLTIPVTDKPRVPHDEDNKLVFEHINKTLSPSSSSPPAPPLSKDEKRVNHIASEQKRRQNIRSGFHQLTDLIPALKSMPHSKSNILFKTADYIKHTEKRNKALQQRLQQLQRRVALSNNAISAATPHYASPSSSSSRYTSTQQQIRRLQQQLLKQQELLVQHNIPHQPLHHAIVMPEDNSPPPPQPASYIPCLHIPADTEFGQESMLRERLLSCGKLKLNRPL
ncbi:hypothetical protein [Absidia glauca]|uniref:BHLH domain-containing protein n=1 Tax=Absidia glauca TaxID=4829 RepID=A0A168KRU1_ABSGL|nr:hypothetical protein [Absidia glauca]